MYVTRKFKLEQSDPLDRLARRAGDLRSPVAKWHWRLVGRSGYWPSKGQAQKMYCKGFDGLHSQSAQAVADSFYDGLQSWRKKRDSGSHEGLRPPDKQKRYGKVQWKSQAIRLRDDGVLRLSNGRGNDPVLIDWPSDRKPKRVEIGREGSQYERRCQYTVEKEEEPWTVNGRELRSLRRQQNRTKARLDSKNDQNEYGSRKWKRLVRTKDQQLEKIRNQIKDLLHKQSTRRHRQAAQRVGKAHTFQACPSCGNKYKLRGREYICGCGFEGHRDLVGATDLRKKYLGQTDPRPPLVSSLQVAGEMASPTGVRDRPYMRTGPHRWNPVTAKKTRFGRQAGRPRGIRAARPVKNLPAPTAIRTSVSPREE